MTSLAFALAIGVVCGLRTFTAPAVLWFFRHGGVWAYALGLAALLEDAGDVHPKAPARTGALGLSARIASGAFCGWQLTAFRGGPAIAGAAIGAIAAIAGAYAGYTVRVRLIAAMGLVPSGLLEDAVAIGAAIAVVAYA